LSLFLQRCEHIYSCLQGQFHLFVPFTALIARGHKSLQSWQLLLTTVRSTCSQQEKVQRRQVLPRAVFTRWIEIWWKQKHPFRQFMSLSWKPGRFSRVQPLMGDSTSTMNVISCQLDTERMKSVLETESNDGHTSHLAARTLFFQNTKHAYMHVAIR
jgi:hypothetical protein